MQAIVLAAGQGKRMRPLTDATPKPMLKVAGKPIIERAIDSLPGAVDEIIIVVGYLKDQIKGFVAERYPDRKVVFVDEDQMLGTAYAVHACKDLMHGRFLVLNGDDLFRKEDLERLVHHDHAMLCVRVPALAEYSRVGRAKVSDDMRFEGFATETESSWVVTGAYTLTADFFTIPLVKLPSGEFGLPQTMLAMVMHYGKQVRVVEGQSWVPIGYPDDLARAEAKLTENK